MSGVNIIIKILIAWFVLFGGAYLFGTVLKERKVERECTQSVERDCDGNQKVLHYEDLVDKEHYRRDDVSATMGEIGYAVMGVQDDLDHEMLQLDNQGSLYVRIAPNDPNVMPVRVVP